MRRKLVPLAGLALAAMALAGCGTVGIPSPEPTPTDAPSAAPAPTPSATIARPSEPVNPAALPGSALLRISATAEVDGERVRLRLTYSRPVTSASAPQKFQAVLDECPNAISSQLDIYAGLEPTGVLVSRLEVDGEWPTGMTFAVAPGGTIASIAEGVDVAPSTDEPGMFGCTVPVVTGPAGAEFLSILLGDPAINDRLDLDAAIARGLYGFETDSGSAGEIRWRDCVVQLSSATQRMATENGWTLPGEWGDGCLIGDGGTV